MDQSLICTRGLYDASLAKLPLRSACESQARYAHVAKNASGENRAAEERGDEGDDGQAEGLGQQLPW